MERPALSLVPPVPSDELELGVRFRDGDRAAFARLVAPHMDALYTLCLRVLGRPTDAEDVAQEALERALRSHGSFDPQRSFRVWLFTIAVNRCRDRMRGPWWSRVLRGEHLVSATIPSCAERVERADADAAVRSALSTLPPIYREALSIYHLEDMSYAEMSQIVGVREGALKQRVLRGREMLRASMLKLYPALAVERMKETGGVLGPCSDTGDSGSQPR